MKKPRAIILRTAGTNCDYETKAAFEMAGALADRVHINSIIRGEVKLSDFQILALPGGFSYGDNIASGKILANELKYRLGDEIRKFDFASKPIIGICNGFQVLVKMGILPGEKDYAQTATLTFNDSDTFESRWVYLKRQGAGVRGKGPKKAVNNFWIDGMPEVIRLPVAHGEGKFVTIESSALNKIEDNGQVAFRYCAPGGVKPEYPFNPNGSTNDIAGICNQRGNVFGLMPHPERFVHAWQSPSKDEADIISGDSAWGLKIFINAVKAAE